MMRVFLTLILLCIAPVAFGGYSHVSGKWSPEKFAPTGSVQEHYDAGTQALQDNYWDHAITHFMTITYHFPESPFYADSLFFAGVGYFYKGQYDLANRQFDQYLDQAGKLKHFQKAFDFKYQIAENFRKGKRKHLFGSEHMPKWSRARGVALDLYDEISAALPASDLSAKSLYSKAKLLRKRRQYKESIDSLKLVIRRFPKHELAAESFLLMAEVYLDQCRIESQNPDFIALARVNLQKFRASFPGDERIEQAADYITAMEGYYADSLFETGRFYERKKKSHASAIYYQDTILKYPESEAAKKSSERLISLGIPLREVPQDGEA